MTNQERKEWEKHMIGENQHPQKEWENSISEQQKKFDDYVRTSMGTMNDIRSADRKKQTIIKGSIFILVVIIVATSAYII